MSVNEEGSIVLTKDLIKCRIQGGKVRPAFVHPEEPGALELAEQLISFFNPDNHPTRGEIDEDLMPLINGHRDVIFAKGLKKILLDRSEFSQPVQEDYPALRAALFETSASFLSQLQGGNQKPEIYVSQVLQKATLPQSFFDKGIYADLPANEELVVFKTMTPAELLERYNVSLVQSLLLRANHLELIIASPDAAKMRRLFKYLRFFRLLARLYKEKKKAVKVVIDGPASVLSESKKYGLQLASFFPAICTLDEWTMKAEVEWKNQKRPLHLNHKAGLVCPYRNFSAYVPEEIRLFHRHFKETVHDWQIVGHTPFLEAGGQELVFPDLSFERQDGRLIHLELFHRWHATQLEQRLALLEEQPDLPLIMGVDRSVAKRPEYAGKLESHPSFASRGFLFNDYPPVNRVEKCLAAFLFSQ